MKLEAYGACWIISRNCYQLQPLFSLDLCESLMDFRERKTVGQERWWPIEDTLLYWHSAG
jgi:hypothetical protein